MKHSKHGAHPHDKMAAIPQFNEGHWQKDVQDVNVADGRYTADNMDQAGSYKKSVDALAAYAKSHKAAH